MSEATSTQGKSSKTKLFVKNLPERATSEEVAEAFSSVGPLRECWVVTQKGSGKCKGFAFVQYVLPADAQRALSEMNKTKLMGRVLGVEFAKPKNRKTRGAEEVEKDASTASEHHQQQPAKRRKRSRKSGSKVQQYQVAVWPLDPLKVQKKHIFKRAKKICQPVEVTFPMAHTPTAALLTVNNATDASKLETKLDQHTFKGSVISAKEVQVSLLCLLCVASGAEPELKILTGLQTTARQEGARLIVRNLSWKVGTKELAEPFKNLGMIVVSTKVPVKENGRKRGFGFVQLATQEEASVAAGKVNATAICGRVVAVDVAVPKDQYIAMNVQDGAGEPTRIKEEPVESGDEGDSAEDDEGEVEHSGHSLEDESETSESTSGQEYSEASEDLKEDDKRQYKKIKEDPHINQTLFIRGLPLHADEEMLLDVFGAFGEIRSCAVCRDKFSGRPRGMAFVQFKKLADAEAVLSKHGTEGNNTTGQGLKTSVITAKESSLMIEGQPAIIARAVSRSEAAKFGKKHKEKDKRNLYLLDEGTIDPESPAAKGVPEKELEKRQSALAEKKRVLRRSTNFFVSKTRLSVKNLPKGLSSTQLQSIFVKQVRTRNGDKFVNVESCRIITDETRGNKSRGFGFIEFSKHEDALLGLRAVNNNPNLLPKNRRLIVSFAVENVLALQAQQRRRAKLEKIKARQAKQSNTKEKHPQKGKQKHQKETPQKNQKESDQQSHTTEAHQPAAPKKKKQRKNKLSKAQVRQKKRQARTQRRKERKRAHKAPKEGGSSQEKKATAAGTPEAPPAAIPPQAKLSSATRGKHAAVRAKRSRKRKRNKEIVEEYQQDKAIKQYKENFKKHTKRKPKENKWFEDS